MSEEMNERALEELRLANDGLKEQLSEAETSRDYLITQVETMTTQLADTKLQLLISQALQSHHKEAGMQLVDVA